MQEEPLPLAGGAFTWYALVKKPTTEQKDDKYASSLYTLGTFATLQDYCRYRHHVPAPEQVFLGTHALRIAQEYYAYGYCVFRADTRPEWEDPRNADGLDLTYRSNAMEPRAMQAAWEDAVLLLLNGALEGATGLRLVHRVDDRWRNLYKFELWCARAHAEAAAEALLGATGLRFLPVERRASTR